MTLKEAREKALESRRALHWGHDPRAVGIPTFEAAVEKVIAIHSPTWKSPSCIAGQWRQTLRDYAHPRIGRKRVSEVATADVLAILQPIWSSKPAAARAVRQRIGAVMKWAVAKGYRPDNPAGDAIAAALPRNGNATRHHKALPHGEVSAALAEVRNSGSHAGVRLALEFMVLTATRSNEVRGSTWDEIEHDVWTIPASRMKAKREHRVPLSRRALEILEEARKRHDDGGLVFRGAKRKNQRLDVQRPAPVSLQRGNAPRDEVLVPRLVLGDGRGARGGRSGAGPCREEQGRGRLRPFRPAGPEARGHGGLGRIRRWRASQLGGRTGPLRRWLTTVTGPKPAYPLYPQRGWRGAPPLRSRRTPALRCGVRARPSCEPCPVAPDGAWPGASARAQWRVQARSTFASAPSSVAATSQAACVRPP